MEKRRKNSDDDGADEVCYMSVVIIIYHVRVG